MSVAGDPYLTPPSLILPPLILPYLPYLTLPPISYLYLPTGMSDAGDRSACQNRFTKLRERDLEAVTAGNDLSFFGNIPCQHALSTHPINMPY